jgi:hypothetical protein
MRILMGLAGGVLLGAAALADPGPVETPVARLGGSPYEQAVLAAHPAAYWRLGEAPGATTAADATKHKHHGEYHGKLHLGQPGALAFDKNTALGLDGPKEKAYVEVAAHKVFSVATSGKGLTVEVWLRPDVLNFAGEPSKDPKNPYIYWLGKGEAGAQEWGFRFYSDEAADRPNRISAYIWNAEGKEGAGAYVQDKLTKHKWLYIVATYDDPDKADARVRIYKNGVASKHNGSPGTLYKSYNIKPATGPAPVRLGTRDLKSFLTGGLDEVAIYPYVLSPEEISKHWKVATETVQPK